MKDDRVYLLHIRDAIRGVLRYTAGGREAFFSDEMTQDAVVRKLEVIGEATKHLSEPFRSAHPEVPWKRMAGMRDKVIHEYFGVDLQLVWDVVRTELPNLLSRIEGFLDAER